MHEKHGGAARSGARRFVDQLETGLLHILKRDLGVADAKCHVGQTAASAVLVDQLLHRRIGAERLQQLHEVGAVPDTQQRLAHLVAAVDFLAMDLPEAEQPIRLHLRIQFALAHRDGHVVHELKTRNIREIFTHNYSNSTRTCPTCTPSPTLALMDRKSTRLNSSHLGISYAV